MNRSSKASYAPASQLNLTEDFGMNIHWTFRHAKKRRGDVLARWQPKQRRLQRLLSRYPPERCHLHLTMTSTAGGDLWELRAVLCLPTGTLVTSETGQYLDQVLDKVADELARLIQKHKAEIRHEHLLRRRRRERASQRAAAPFLQEERERKRPAAFFELLKPLLTTVRNHAHRELRIMELEQVIPRGEITADDLTDDVLVAAWEQFTQRPHNMPLDVWLLRLLRDRLAEIKKNRGAVELSSPVEHVLQTEDDTEDFDPDDLQCWLSRALGRPRPISLEDILVDEAAPDSWHQLEVEEEWERILACLSDLPTHQREAFLLSVVDGLDVDEIAMALDRSEMEVRNDIEQTRTTIKQMLGKVQSAPGAK